MCVYVCGVRVDEVCMCVCFAAVICSLVKCAQILPRFNFYLLEFLLLIIYIFLFVFNTLFMSTTTAIYNNKLSTISTLGPINHDCKLKI